MNILNWIPGGKTAQIAAGCALAALGTFGAMQLYDAIWDDPRVRADVRTKIESQAALNALDRIEQMGERNAEFLDLPAYERCIVFMRDSSLPVDQCDERFGLSVRPIHEP